MIIITADIDTKSKPYLIWCFLKAIYKIENIKKIEVSPSVKKGYHLTVWTTYPYTVKQQFKLREFIGDDPFRIKLDKIRRIGRNTFFYKKVK